MEALAQENLILNSDDDEELPDLFHCDDNVNQNEEKNQNILPGDIVWAEFRQLYWPSLVRKVFKKERKLSVWYLDSPRKCFKVAFKSVKKFSDPEIAKNINKEIENSPIKAVHRKVYFNAITYMRRKAEGCKDDPGAYFDLNKHYLAFKSAKIEEACSDSNLSLEAAQEMHSNVSDEESNAETDLDEDAFSMEKKISEFYYLEDTSEINERTEAIVKCIKAGSVDKYLRQVKARKVPSNYQVAFDNAMKTDRRKLFSVTACDIVKSRSQLREISVYLMDFYEQIVEGGKCEMVDYITSVWLPEAINKAAELIDDRTNDSQSGIARKLFAEMKDKEKELGAESEDRNSMSLPKKRAAKRFARKCSKGRKKPNK